MKWYQNLKVSSKLILGFSLVIIMAAFIGIYGRVGLQNSRQEAGTTFENYGNAQGYLGYVMGAFQEQYSAMADALVYNTPEDMDESLGILADIREEMPAKLEKYKNTCVTQDDMDEYLVIEGKMNDFWALTEQFAGHGAAGDTQACQELFTSDEMCDLTVELTDLLFAAQANNETQAIEHLDDYNRRVSTQENVMLYVMIGALLMAVVSIYYVAISIAKPLGALSDAAESLAAGNTAEVDVRALYGKDETGQLAQAFAKVVDALRALIADTDMLADAAREGKLSQRADANAHQGDYRRLVQGINETIEGVVAPVQVAADVLSKMADGNLSVRVTGQYKGEHALIQDALNRTLDSLNNYIAQVRQALGSMAQGDFSGQITEEFRGDFAALKDSINAIANALNDVMAGINTAAQQVAVGTQQVSDGAQEVSQGSSQQTASIEELTASVSQITAQIQDTANNARVANEQAQKTGEQAGKGFEQMQLLQAAMGEIDESAENISRIIKVIDDIAFQTNILALNAAVEAASAGMHGKGFAVVAEEVRSLAAKSADAARETAELIEGSARNTAKGVLLAEETAQSLDSIVSSVSKAGEVIAQIAGAADEQAQGIAQIDRGIEQMSQVVQNNSATTQQAAAASEELAGQADMLKAMVARFKLANR